MARIVMAMSGGVDSSVAAALLCRAGHDVIGVFMRHGEAPVAETAACSAERTVGNQLPIVTGRLDHKQGCCSATDAEDARRVANSLDIPFYALNLSDDFARIIDYFVDEYSSARTPNPCIMCNNWLKFGKLFDYADSVNAEFVATGHYARVQGSGARVQGSGFRGEELEVKAISEEGDHETPGGALLRGHDADKDQSYVLFGVDRKYLSRMMLPVGGYRKSEIRALARELGLRVADKPDSQEICFVSSGDHADFVRRRRRGDRALATSIVEEKWNKDVECSAGTLTPALSRREREQDLDTSGEILLADGTVVGHHEGIEGFTIGQRKGLRVAMGEPYYVTQIEADSHRVYIGPREELARAELTANRSNWLIDPPTAAFRGLVQIRYNSDATPARIEPLNDGRFRVEFDEPCYGIAPGQAAVCYDGNRVLGGGWIE